MVHQVPVALRCAPGCFGHRLLRRGDAVRGGGGPRGSSRKHLPGAFGASRRQLGSGAKDPLGLTAWPAGSAVLAEGMGRAQQWLAAVVAGTLGGSAAGFLAYMCSGDSGMHHNYRLSWHDPLAEAGRTHSTIWDGDVGCNDRTEGRAVYAPGQLTTERPIWQKTSMKLKLPMS